METKPNYLLAGSFVIGLAVALFCFLLWIAQNKNPENYSNYTIYFNGSVSGMEKGSVVRFRGIPVGNVTDIRVDPTNIERIKVVVRLANDTPIKEDTVATLNYQGVTGLTYIELVGGTQEAKTLVAQANQQYPVIRSQSSDINRLIEAAPQMIAKFTQLADQAALLLSDKNLSAFSESLDNFRKLSVVIAAKTDTLDRMINDTSKAAQKLASVSTALDKDLPKTLRGFTLASEDLVITSHTIKDVIYNNRSQLNSSITDLTKLIRETRDTMRHVNGLARDFSASPSSVLFAHERKGIKVAP
jgi:phospholipid/cholesterol/gamma-HCH transport system substrate-binding protein